MNFIVQRYHQTGDFLRILTLITHGDCLPGYWLGLNDCDSICVKKHNTRYESMESRISLVIFRVIIAIM